jgi:hypothetical protein
MSEVSCEHVRDALRLGQIPLPPALLAHAEGCGECSLLLADDATLGKALSAEGDAQGTNAPLWAGLDALVQEEVGFRAWFRSRPNPVRVLSAGAAFALATALGLRHLRSDFARVPALELALLLSTFALLGGLTAGRALPVLGARPKRIPSGAILGAALGLPALAAFVRTATTLVPAPDGATFLRQAWSCFSYGSLLTIPLVAVLWLLDRGAGPHSRIFHGAALAGLAANAALTLHCPNGSSAHLFVGHATIGVALATVAALVTRRR